MTAPLIMPVDAVLHSITAALQNSNVVIVAPPGSGKTTRVPAALPGRVVVVEPRRIAARMAASWVAASRGEAVGGEIGYQVRFDARCGPQTRVQYVTDGVLARRLLDDPLLQGTDVVVIDEFHERHLQADLLAAWLRWLQGSARPDLRLVVMSATIDPAPVAAWLGDAAVVEAPGRMYEVTVDYDEPGDRALDVRVAAAVRGALDRDAAGDVLVFLPGAAEIRRAMGACAAVVAHRGVDAQALHGDLPLDQQASVMRRGARRRVIFATNVAESSITVEGITTVIDSGLARRARTQAWSGLNEIRVEKISRASAEQRAGRAGRLQPGRCVRLYTAYDHAHRPVRDAAEIHCVELSEPLLLLMGAGVNDPQTLPWFEPPTEAAVAQGRTLLRRLGAIDDAGLTAVGRQMLSMPLHPRLSRLVMEAERLGAADDGRLAAAALSEGDPRLQSRARLGSPSHHVAQRGPSDVLALIDACRHGHDVDAGALRRIERLAKGLRRPAMRASALASTPRDAEEALMRAVLAAWPDRVARRREGERSSTVLLCGGGTARLSETSVVGDASWLVCVDAEERAGGALIRIASEIDPAWLLDLDIERVCEIEERVWNERSERVEGVRRLMYERLVIDESRYPAPRDAETAARLLEAARRSGVGAFADVGALDGLRQRIAFTASVVGDAALTESGALREEDLLAAICEGCVSFEEVRAALRQGGLLAALERGLSSASRRMLDQMAPLHVVLKGRRVPVHYEAGRDPWIASRLQDFFGMREGPRIAQGRVPLVLHLLAPNQRPVQITTDLAGFWTRTYPSVRRELARRYPRHPWPEDPLAAKV